MLWNGFLCIHSFPQLFADICIYIFRMVQKNQLSILVKRLPVCIFSLYAFLGGNNVISQKPANTLHELNTLLIHTVMEDLFTPPVANRIYVYPNIAFYECIHNADASYESLAGKLTGLNPLPAPATGSQVDHFIAACISFSYVAQSLVGSEYKIEDWRKKFIDSVRSNMDSIRFIHSVRYGHAVADSIIAWSKRDKYLISKGMQRHVLSKKAGAWQPTPNEYLQALEPHWNIIRPMTMVTAGQFSPPKKLQYNPSRRSEFFKNVQEVYRISKNRDTLRRSKALYWDDNPNISIQEGHLTYYVHKISPAGHWLMITRQACMENDVAVLKSSLAYTMTAISMFDGFIGCWDEKFKIDLIRPVTVINHFIDENWQPLIQTPPFPEFTSGHAVISNAAATVLTKIFGDHYRFTDNTEIPFGIKPRTFESFYKAAEESSWSRVYGGIHYPETARISISQGKLIGQHVLKFCSMPALNK